MRQKNVAKDKNRMLTCSFCFCRKCICIFNKKVLIVGESYRMSQKKRLCFLTGAEETPEQRTDKRGSSGVRSSYGDIPSNEISFHPVEAR